MRPTGRGRRLDLRPVQRWFPGKGAFWVSPNPGVFYSSKVRARLGWWKNNGASRLTVSVLKTGYKLQFTHNPTPLRTSPLMVPDEDVEFALKDLKEGDACGAYGPLLPGGENFLARMRVHHTPPKRRMVVNLRHVNAFIKQKTCRYEGVKDLPKVIRPGDFMFSWDAKRAFSSIPLHRGTAHFLSFHIAVPCHYVVDGILHEVPLQEGGYFVQLPGGGRYQVIERTCLALPFGFTMSPLVWAKVFKVLTRALRKAGIPCLIYVDDGMASMPSRAAALVARDLVQQLFLQSGLTRALDKGAWEPSQVLEDHLGFRIDSRGQGSIRLPERRCRDIRARAKDLLCRAARRARFVPSSLLQEFLGKTASTSPAIRDARLQARALHDCIDLWHESSRLDREALRALQFWAVLSEESPCNGKVMWPSSPTKVVYTDASGTLGYGCIVRQATTPPKAAFRPELARFGGYWTPEEIPFHITLKELVAVRKGVQECAVLLKGHRVLFWQDNQCVVAIVRNRTSRSKLLMVELRRLLQLLDDLKIDLEMKYIRSALNPADELSRLTHRDAWGLKARLQRSLLREVQTLLGASITLDPFACHRSAVVPRYCSRFGEPTSLGDDGLKICWEDEVLWLCPPWALLHEVLIKLEKEPTAKGVLIVPEWPTQPWWPKLQNLQGRRLKLPPPKFAVSAFHIACVEPRLHPALRLQAIVFGNGI